ncbi:BadM/Rrf2 family transcriptional regulator [Paucibacter sp. KBW04]|uniref:Rrf2 family transcriptional regulator n=1 Tax=Paucibacter sp. KBW04 TaxID=2153361 RepID=UPI000F58B3E4|nr:Rrf2 family transcriptional regulator [Paucibacter sp. KBW04]RQO56906.1 BadM/Rrf2 family transcriptional regulator [Paucibacter sp. KBW04]
MKLSSFTDYALRVLIYLASDSSRRATIAEIAQAFQISENHLIKVVHLLGQKGWVSTVRGKGGGLSLAYAAQDIVVGQVVRDTEGAALPAECFNSDGGQCCIAPICQLRDVLAEAVQAFYQVLDAYTLADLVQKPQAFARLLFRERAHKA